MPPKISSMSSKGDDGLSCAIEIVGGVECEWDDSSSTDISRGAGELHVVGTLDDSSWNWDKSEST